MTGGSFTALADSLIDDYGTLQTVVADDDAAIVAAVRGVVALRAVADDLLARLTAQADRVGAARRSGMSL
ncbi:hypothetical protein, partial [Williamsia sp. M5A3_1d]